MTGYTKTFEIKAPPQAVFEAITRGIVQWWTTGSGDASQAGEMFTTRFGPTYNHIKVSHLTPDRRVEWDILEHYHENETLNRDDEWTGTRIVWKLAPLGDTHTKLEFMHEGLVESMECWEICEAGWDFFLLDSLKPYLESGSGQPFQHQQ